MGCGFLPHFVKSITALYSNIPWTSDDSVEALDLGEARFRRGLGERDHSWAVRDWNPPKMWTWLTFQFSEKGALNVTKLIMDAGEVDAGFIHRKGRTFPSSRGTSKLSGMQPAAARNSK